jgi:hypothetical protein
MANRKKIIKIITGLKSVILRRRRTDFPPATFINKRTERAGRTRGCGRS